MPLRWSFLVGLLGLAACAVGGPGVPPMSPYEVSGRYGYREAALTDNRLEVNYVGPTRNAYGYAGRDSPGERQVTSQAYDFALWRSAQLAQARGFAGFTLADTKIDLRTRNEPGYYERPRGLAGVGYGSGSGVAATTGLSFGSGLGTDGYSSIHASVTLTIALSNGAAEKYFDAAAVIAQARATYPGAESVAVR